MSGESHGSPSELSCDEYERQMLIQLFQKCDSEIRDQIQKNFLHLISNFSRNLKVHSFFGWWPHFFVAGIKVPPKKLVGSKICSKRLGGQNLV